MQSPSLLPTVQQFIFDCAELASSLDSLDTRGYRHELLAAIRGGQTQYHSLLQRRQALSPSALEEAWVDFMLDSLLARLSYLENRTGICRQGIRKSPSSHIASQESC